MKKRHSSIFIISSVCMLLQFLSTITFVRALAPANAPCTITMDGSISSSEWACAEKKSTFFLDVSNVPDGNGHVNVDGNNYLYLAEDQTNLYVGSMHRMFEIRIPKSEIEHYDSNGNLGIMVGGYGTLAFPDSNYWVYSKVMTAMLIQQSDKYYYFNMQGLETPNGVPGYDLLVLTGVASALVACLAIKRARATR